MTNSLIRSINDINMITLLKSDDFSLLFRLRSIFLSIFCDYD